MCKAYCDYGHETNESRRLPLGEDSAVIVCRKHYAKELAFRREINRESGTEVWGPESFPTWESLEIYGVTE